MAQRGRQDYIAKIRYQNDLPPPPLLPKLLSYNNINNNNRLENLSSLFRKQNFNELIELDEDLGMAVDLLSFPGVVTFGDESAMYGTINDKLAAEDRILLREPGANKVSKSEPGVSFLRRTEYISEKKTSVNRGNVENKRKESETDPKAQLRAVEATFDFANETKDDLRKLVHPKKKLRAKRCWPLLPDTSKMDQVFLGIKLLGSAGVSRIAEEKDKHELQTSIFKPITLDSGEWMAYYTTTTKSSIELKRKIDNIAKENEDEDESYKFKHIRDFDMKFTRFEKAVEEMSIKFNDQTALYVPIGGRIDLKRRRTGGNKSLSQVVEDQTFDRIDFKLREPSTDEIINRDNQRNNYDPMEYTAYDEGDDEVDDE